MIPRLQEWDWTVKMNKKTPQKKESKRMKKMKQKSKKKMRQLKKPPKPQKTKKKYLARNCSKEKSSRRSGVQREQWQEEQ
jgi:hypothetical protein